MGKKAIIVGSAILVIVTLIVGFKALITSPQGLVEKTIESIQQNRISNLDIREDDIIKIQSMFSQFKWPQNLA